MRPVSFKIAGAVILAWGILWSATSGQRLGTFRHGDSVVSVAVSLLGVGAAGWDLFDPKYADLYWNQTTGKYEDFIEEWKAKVKEVADLLEISVSTVEQEWRVARAFLRRRLDTR